MTGRILVAGIGNVFLSDDGFGVEVIRALGGWDAPPGVEIVDVGIRGVHLAYDLLDGCALLVLVDAAARGVDPGTVSVLEVPRSEPTAGVPIDAHAMAPDAVLALLARLGGRPDRTLVVTCEPADIGPGMGLSGPVLAAVPHAVRAVVEIVTAAVGTIGTPAQPAGPAAR